MLIFSLHGKSIKVAHNDILFRWVQKMMRNSGTDISFFELRRVQLQKNIRVGQTLFKNFRSGLALSISILTPSIQIEEFKSNFVSILVKFLRKLWKTLLVKTKFWISVANKNLIQTSPKALLINKKYVAFSAIHYKSPS